MRVSAGLMRVSAWSLAFVACCAPAFALAGDEQAPAPPVLPRGWSPPPPMPSASPAIDEARLAAMIDDAVDRALARQSASRAGPQAPAYASPQGAATPPPRPSAAVRIVAAEPARAVGTVPAYSESREYVTVMVAAPWHKRAMAAVGARMVECGKPRLRSMRVAPSAVVQELAPARAVYASGQGY